MKELKDIRLRTWLYDDERNVIEVLSFDSITNELKCRELNSGEIYEYELNEVKGIYLDEEFLFSIGYRIRRNCNGEIMDGYMEYEEKIPIDIGLIKIGDGWTIDNYHGFSYDDNPYIYFHQLQNALWQRDRFEFKW